MRSILIILFFMLIVVSAKSQKWLEYYFGSQYRLVCSDNVLGGHEKEKDFT
jgi:hypothetical protein